MAGLLRSLPVLLQLPPLHIGVHGLGDLLGMGDGLDDRARARDDVAGGEDAGAGRPAVFIGDEQAALAALEETLGANPAFRSLRAVQEGRMQVLPKELFHNKPNARWAESYEYLYEMLFQK